MKLVERLKRKIFQPEEKAPGKGREILKPIIIEFESYGNYSREKKYNDLLSYMNRFSKLEEDVFDFFYIRLKPLFDMDCRDILGD